MSSLPPIGPTSRYFTSQRLRLHYNDWGNEGAPLLLLLHGGRDHGRNWDWVAQQLRDDYHIIAPDLRGHGDSQWSQDGNYTLSAFVYDLAQLIHQLGFAQIPIVAHSLGAAITLRYAGLYPETVSRIVAIEGTGTAILPSRLAGTDPVDIRFRNWIERRRKLAGRMPRRYARLEDAIARMQEENSFLSDEQARHLTIHAVNRNEDGSWSWKFDNYLRDIAPVSITEDELFYLWGKITCPTLLCWGTKSWASDPETDGTLPHFRNARVRKFDNAGHWLHHDQCDTFVRDVRAFLA